MNARELAVFLACLGCAISCVMLINWRKRDVAGRVQRLDAMLAALRDPALDAATRAELLRAIAHDHLGWFGQVWTRVANPQVWRVLWFSAGWITLVLAGTALILEVLEVTHYGGEAPAIFVALGFAMVTLPMAWREVARRDSVATETH